MIGSIETHWFERSLSQMSSLADRPEVIGFFSYSREDDEDSEGMLSALRVRIQRELSAQLGRSKTTLRLWQDQEAIAPGKLWETEIKAAVNQAVFFIPIVTPRAVRSDYCKFEFEVFLARERALARADLVFPLLYINVPALETETQWRKDPVLSIIGIRQYVDWRRFRHFDPRTTDVREAIERFCHKIVEALREPWVSGEERGRQEAEAKRRANQKQRRAEAARQAWEKKRRTEPAQQAKGQREQTSLGEGRAVVATIEKAASSKPASAEEPHTLRGSPARRAAVSGVIAPARQERLSSASQFTLDLSIISKISKKFLGKSTYISVYPHIPPSREQFGRSSGDVPMDETVWIVFDYPDSRSKGYLVAGCRAIYYKYFTKTFTIGYENLRTAEIVEFGGNFFGAAGVRIGDVELPFGRDLRSETRDFLRSLQVSLLAQ